MAEAFPNPMEEISEALLCCTICKEAFDSQSRTPRVLPCHHTFCSQCLENLSKGGKLSCPMCRREVEVSGPFPVDTTRAALLDIQEAVKTQQEAPCEGCDDGSRATSRCLECSQFLCDDCCEAHGKMKMLKGHTIVSLSEAARSPSTLLRKVEMCQKHKDKKLEFYCKVCETTVCSTCAITLHVHKENEGCNILELNDVLAHSKNEVESLCRELDEIRESSFQPRAKLASSSVEEMDAAFKEAAKEIEDIFSKANIALSDRKAEAMASLLSKVKVERLELEDQASETESLESGAKTCTALGRTVASMGLPSHVLAQKQELERAVQEARAQVGKLLKASPRYKVEVDISQYLRSLQSIGSITSGKEPYLYVPDNQMISCPAFQLQRDRCGNGCALTADGRGLIGQQQAAIHLAFGASPADVQSLFHGFVAGPGDVQSTSQCFGANPGSVQSTSERYGFPGTCSTTSLTQPHAYFWQITSRVKDGNPGCKFEVGLATGKALRACSGSSRLSDYDVNAPTVVAVLEMSQHDGFGEKRKECKLKGQRGGLGQKHTECRLKGRQWDKTLDTDPIAAQPNAECNSPPGRNYPCGQLSVSDREYVDLHEMNCGDMEMTVGFLYDNRQPQSPCLFLVETQSSRLLGVRRLPPSQPLWPVFRIWPGHASDVIVELPAEPGAVSYVTLRLLQDLLARR